MTLLVIQCARQTISESLIPKIRVQNQPTAANIDPTIPRFHRTNRVSIATKKPRSLNEQKAIIIESYSATTCGFQ